MSAASDPSTSQDAESSFSDENPLELRRTVRRGAEIRNTGEERKRHRAAWRRAVKKREPADGILLELEFLDDSEMAISTLHEQDFYAWTQLQAHLLKTGQISSLDVEHLVEEIEDMGGSVRNQLESRLGILLMHLLKWRFQPSFRGCSWQLTIKEQRRKIERLVRKNPSLKATLEEMIADAYGDAILTAARETGLDESVFPETCPYGLSDILNPEFLPD